MRHAHFAEICEKCGNMQNMQQSHIRIKLTCLISCQKDNNTAVSAGDMTPTPVSVVLIMQRGFPIPSTVSPGHHKLQAKKYWHR